MTIDPGTAIAVGMPMIVGLIWLIRLEGRVNMGERRHEDRDGDIAEIKKDVKQLLQRSYGARNSDS